MAQINLRGVTEELYGELKEEAARKGMKFAAYCVGVLEARKGGDQGQGLVLSPGTVRGVAREDVMQGVPTWPELASAQTPKLIDPEVSADETERQRRRDKKATRHQELKAGALANMPPVDPPRMQEKMQQHDPSTCRIYKCGTCKVMKVRDIARGLNG